MDCFGSLFAIVCLLLVVFVKENVGIKCVQCISSPIYEGEDCGDPLTPDSKSKWNQDCTNATTRPWNGCRKIVQEVGDDYRIVRQCASETLVDGKVVDQCMDRAGTKGIKLRYCICAGDGCNEATSAVLSTLLMIVMAVTVGQFF